MLLQINNHCSQYKLSYYVVINMPPQKTNKILLLLAESEHGRPYNQSTCKVIKQNIPQWKSASSTFVYSVVWHPMVLSQFLPPSLCAVAG